MWNCVSFEDCLREVDGRWEMGDGKASLWVNLDVLDRLVGWGRLGVENWYWAGIVWF